MAFRKAIFLASPTDPTQAGSMTHYQGESPCARPCLRSISHLKRWYSTVAVSLCYSSYKQALSNPPTYAIFFAVHNRPLPLLWVLHVSWNRHTFLAFEEFPLSGASLISNIVNTGNVCRLYRSIESSWVWLFCRSLLTLGDRDAQLELIKMLQGSSQPESQIGNGIEKRHSHQASATNSGSVQQHSAGELRLQSSSRKIR